jgi:hypothetical protein
MLSRKDCGIGNAQLFLFGFRRLELMSVHALQNDRFLRPLAALQVKRAGCY